MNRCEHGIESFPGLCPDCVRDEARELGACAMCFARCDASALDADHLCGSCRDNKEGVDVQS